MPPPWLVGLGALPYALVVGFSVTALPYVLARAEVPVDRVAVVSAVSLSPLFWAFLFSPVLDRGLTRRTYALILASAAAALVASSLFTFERHHLVRLTVLLSLANVAIAMQSSAIAGWMSQFVPNELRNRAGAWINAVNLGGGATGATLVMAGVNHVTLASTAIWFGAAVALSCVAVLAFPDETERQSSRSGTSGLLHTLPQLLRRPEVAVGLTLFIAPASCGAAINLVASLGRDFHASPETVLTTTGVGAALAGIAGAAAGGWIGERHDRKLAYLAGGLLSGVCAFLVAVAPRTSLAYVISVLAYATIFGFCLTLFVALSLELLGSGSMMVSTEFALFAAALNAASGYMTWLDGWGYRAAGATGLFVVDGSASLISATVLVVFLHHRGYVAARL